MSDEIKCIQPEDPFSPERVNTGADDGTRAESMMLADQWVARSALFKRAQYFDQMNEGQKKFYSSLAPNARNKGLRGEVLSIRINTPFDPSDSSYQTVKKFGLDGRTLKMQEYRVFLLALELGRRILEAARGDTPVDADEAFRENGSAINTGPCERHPDLNCYCKTGDPPRDLFRTAVSEGKPIPWQTHCCSGNHDSEEHCYCLPIDTDSYENLPSEPDDFTDFRVQEFNDLTVEQQAESENLTFQPLPDDSCPTEEQPKVFLEFIKKKELIEDEDNVVAVRIFYVIPKSLNLDFGAEILRMLEENQKCQKKDEVGRFRMDRGIKTKFAFLEAIDRAMYLERDLHSNPQKNPDPVTRDMHKSDETFREKIKDILDFKKDTNKMKKSKHAKDGEWSYLKDTIHQDSADYPFDLLNYYADGLFCPKPCITENMVDLQYSLLQRKDGKHALLEKQKLEDYKIELSHYEWRRARESTLVRAEPTPTGDGPAPSKQLAHNPCQEEFNSVLNSALNALSETEKDKVAGTVKLWKKEDDGSTFNILRHNQSRRRVAYLEEGRKNKTNAEAREQFRKYVHESVVEIRRAARDPNNFYSTKGAIRTPEMLSGREENAIYKHPPWSPWHLGIRKHVAPNLGVGDLFIVELFKVIETLFFVSTHMGILLFCWICGGDAFTTRRDKCNFCFVGGPDVGKSHAMNICKQHMFMPSTYMMKTKQSDTAMDDTHIMHTREWCEEQDTRYCLKNPKFAQLQDIEKNRLTAAVMYKLVRKQFKDDNDCNRWVTKMVITLFCAQTGSSTNVTELSKFVEAWRSRVVLVYVPKIKRTEGNRSVSAMVSAQAQRSESNKRQEGRYDAKCIYYDFLRFVMTVMLNQGVLPGPSRKVFNIIVDKMKDKMKDKFKINTRTELRMYGKAVQFMFVRVIETLFNHRKPDTELVLGFVPISNRDPWTMKDEEFQKLFVAPECMETLKKTSECEVFLVDSRGNKVDCEGNRTYDGENYRLNMSEEKLYGKKGVVGFVRTFQRYVRGDLEGEFVGGPRDPDELPDTCLGEFYRQWTGFNHANFERFVNFINPMLCITMEDTVRAIWHSRHEFWADRFALFEKQLIQIGIQKLKNPEIRDCKNSKRSSFFYKIQENNGDESDFVNYDYIRYGTKTQTIQMIMNAESDYPKGYKVQADYHTIEDMLNKMQEKHDSLGHKHLGPSFIPTDGGEPYWGELKLASGTAPDLDAIMPLGREQKSTNDLSLPDEQKDWGAYAISGQLSCQDPEEKAEAKRLQYARYQHAHPDGKETSGGSVIDTGRVVSTDFKSPYLKCVGNNTRNPMIYFSVKAIKEAYGKRNVKWEDNNELIKFFEEHLGFKYDGFKISQEDSEKFIAAAQKEAEKKAEKAKKKFSDRPEQLKEELEFIAEELEEDCERLQGLVAGEGEEVGKTILLGSPYLGTAKGKLSSFDTELTEKRLCQSQTSAYVKVPHSESTLRTTSGNVPSNDTVELLGLEVKDANPDNRETTVSYNNLVNMDRHHKTLKNCPDDTKVDHYRALVSEGSFQFSSADEINRRMHMGLEDSDYQFPKEEGVQYPDNQAMREELELTMRKVPDSRTRKGCLVEGYKWVPFHDKKKRKRDLPDEMIASIRKRRPKRQLTQLI